MKRIKWIDTAKGIAMIYGGKNKYKKYYKSDYGYGSDSRYGQKSKTNFGSVKNNETSDPPYDTKVGEE